MSLCAAVANIGGVIHTRNAARLIHAVLHLLRQTVQMNAAGVRVAEHVLNQNLRLLNILSRKARTELQSVKLRPQLSFLDQIILVGHCTLLRQLLFIQSELFWEQLA